MLQKMLWLVHTSFGHLLEMFLSEVLLTWNSCKLSRFSNVNCDSDFIILKQIALNTDAWYSVVLCSYQRDGMYQQEMWVLKTLGAGLVVHSVGSVLRKRLKALAYVHDGYSSGWRCKSDQPMWSLFALHFSANRIALQTAPTNHIALFKFVVTQNQKLICTHNEHKHNHSNVWLRFWISTPCSVYYCSAHKIIKIF